MIFMVSRATHKRPLTFDALRFERPRRMLQAVGAVVLICANVNAQAQDGKAKKLAQKAIYDDYLNLRFDEAAAKLKQATRLCERGCSPTVTASVYRDLGVVYVAGQDNRSDGVQAFVQAINADPRIELDKDLANPEVQSAFAEAREIAGEPVASSNAAAAESRTASGAIVHRPPTEQTINTPLPLFVASKPGEEIARVTAFIKGFGMARYRKLELSKLPKGFGGETKCSDVGGSTGAFRYYVIGYDEEGAPVGRAGSEDDPIVVQIRRELDGDAPSLPGAEPPEPCAAAQAAEDCPPDFPGCGMDEWGEDEDSEPESETSDFPRHWVSASFQMDFFMMPGGDNVCGTERDAGWECFYGDGTYRNPLPGLAGEPGNPDGSGRGEVSSGLVPATMRVMLGYDYLMLDWLSLGARVGFAFNGGPQLVTTQPSTEVNDTGEPVETEISNPAFLPVHAEGRIGIWFGSPNGIRPHLTLAGGLAQIDAKVITPIVEPLRQNVVDCPDPSDLDCTQADIEAWRTGGTIFASGGAGVLVPLADGHGLDIEAKYIMLFPDSAQAIGVQAGYMLGF